ncbi:hypothetical protein [Flavobacterium commune]|uniref:DUF4468 domain-containing protein n=1 Tax=Flavobacterium commune TaxID=1306519 RepID=A0A1D9PAM3_9FLAO|nr:hypothetical protein [Flavobacterium commune]AOZ99623.1 hypothetical protein BIW12_09305 [Flavobacterium commune]
MKKIILLGLLLVGFGCFAQNETTEKEYNYLTKGLKIQKESGLDVIAGYEFKNEEMLFIDKGFAFTFSDFIEKSTGNLKGVSVVISSQISGNTYYVCIPVNKSAYNYVYEKVIDSFTIDLAKAYAKALSIRYAKIDQQIVDKI